MDQAQWRRYTEWPLSGVALLFLGVFAWQVIDQPTGSSAVAAESIINATWAVFIVDYLVTLILARPRWRWFYTHLFDLAIVALPLLRPLRLLRLVVLLRVLQRAAGTALRGRVVVYAAGSALLLVFVGALAVLDTERGAPGASITTFGRAIWWAFVTITTVGYGDVYPVTDEGRLIAVAVMLGGIALIGVVTATLASWIVERVAQQDEESQAATRRQVADLARQIDELTRALKDGRGESPE
ncbi:MAG TPA: ion channel [Lacisediminihabitans sp.]|uniref:potassium channel family protein n=1 Tax=Lacisediminihabitans sp. TaxID=2787631 RepID=UPI002ED94C1A